jgi:uncharacterized protein (DUF433 family)
MNWSECPDVESNAGVVSGAYVVKGTRVPVDAIIDNADDGFSPEEIAAEIYPTVPVAAVRQIVAFAPRQHAHSVG